MAQTTSMAHVICEACSSHFHPNAYEQHVNGKKHKIRQDQYDKANKTIFISGTSRVTAADLGKLFVKYGQIFKVQKHPSKPFAFIQYVDKDSVVRAIQAQVYFGGKRLFVKKYEDNRYKQFGHEENQEKSRKLSETLSNTSQVEEEEGPVPSLGVKDLPVQIEDPECGYQDVFQWQIHNFISQVEMPAERYQSLGEVMSDVENLLSPVLPGCRVVVFGSCGSTLAFRNSDVDLYLQTANGEPPKDFVRREAKEMYRSRLFRIIARIPMARVPIVKFEHVRTGWQGDLTANSQLGVRNSQLIRFLVSLDPRIKPLIMVIKYWAKVCGVTGTQSQFTTYSLVMIVVFYLQQLDPPILPTIAQLQQMSQHKQFSLGWECSFCDEECRVRSECLSQPNSLSLHQLLTGFFRFFLNFDYENVICPLLGRCIPVSCFESSDGSNLPEEMFLYRERLKTDPKCKFRTNVNFRVQDPFELCLNITRNVGERTFSIFKEACKVSLELCEKEEETKLLKSLFSINEDLLDVGEYLVNVKINVQGEISKLEESSFEEWYQDTVESIMLVLRQIYKVSADPLSGKVCSKVKKLEESVDVHTPINNHSSDKLLFSCCGKAPVWNSRKKMSRFMNSMQIALNPFEREVCISNALDQPSNDVFHFTLTISSLESLKQGGKEIEVQVKTKKQKSPKIKGFLQSIKTDFSCYIVKAQDFIRKIRTTPPVTEVKESLKELFELKLENLPNIKELLLRKNEILRGKAVEEKSVVKQKVQETKTTAGDSESKQPELEDKIVPIDEKVTSKVVEINCPLSSEHLTTGETQSLIDNFFKHTSTSQSSDVKKSDTCSENSDIAKFNALLSAIQKVETLTTFNSEDTNICPFLASIEKMAVKPAGIESKSDETRVESGFESQNLENQKKLQIVNKKEAENLENPLEQEYKNEGIKIQREENTSQLEKLMSNVNKLDEASKTGEILKTSDQEKTKINECGAHTLSKSEPEVSDSRCRNDQIVEPQLSLQRPKKHSEIPLKQRKPYINRYNRNAGRQANQSRNVAPGQPWDGGGPSDRHPQEQLHHSTTQDSRHQRDQGNYHRGSRRHNASNLYCQIKNQYPGLFRDSGY